MSSATNAGELPRHPAPNEGTVSQPLLWYGLFGGAAAWSVQLLVNYWLFAHYCYPTASPEALPIWDGVRLTSIFVDAAFILVAVGAFLVSLRSWFRLRGETHRERGGAESEEAAETGEGRTRFMALSGMLVSGIFVYAVLMNSVPTFFMPICVF